MKAPGGRGLLFALGVAAAMVATTAGTGTPAGAGPRTREASGEIVVERVRGPERRAARQYWTPERLATAQPRELVLTDVGPIVHAAGDTLAKKVKKPYTTFNKRVQGVVFFTTPNGAPTRCSGTAIAGEVPVVWTAGHCVYEPTVGEMENVIFIPGYRSEKRDPEPFGRFPAAELASVDHWQDFENFRFDFGAFTVGTNSEGQSLGSVVGGRDLLTGYNPGAVGKFRPYGYPAQPPFNGNAQWKCRSSFRGHDPRLDEFDDGLPGVDPLKIKCDLNKGSSGGGWRVGPTQIASNVSYSWGNPHKLYGPYLGQEAQDLLDSLAGP